MIPLFIIFASIAIIILIKAVTKKKNSGEIGAKGEVLVAKKLNEYKTKNSRLLNDVVLLDSNGESYQIDHILINENGVWIIETKNWSGMIFGSDEQKTWTQVLAYGKEKNHVYSPVKQNLTHVYKIQKILTKSAPLIPLVVFVSADITNVYSGYVCNLDNLHLIINKNYGFYLTGQEIEKYYKKILFYKTKCRVTSEEHSYKREIKQEGIKRGICPNCGGRLVERMGKSRSFYGCSNYPNCRFTMNKKN